MTGLLEPTPRRRSFGKRKLLGKAWCGIALAVMTVLSPLKAGVVVGDSMNPTLSSGRVYVMDRGYFRTQPIRRGEIVVFKRKGISYIKRVVAAPGDTIYLLRYHGSDADELIQDWQLDLVRRAVSRPPWSRGMRLVSKRVPSGFYYVLGDNMTGSLDSRVFGAIPEADIQGRMLFAPTSRPDLAHVAGVFSQPLKS